MEEDRIGECAGLTFFLGRTSDYEDVMSISDNIYNGNDYLPYRYHEWICEPHRVVILARREGRLMALVSGLVVDAGHTVVVEGLRVCPTERGQGLAGIIQRFMEQYILQRYPSIRVKRLTWGHDPGPEKLAKFTVLARRAILSLQVDPEGIDTFLSALRAKLGMEAGMESRLVVLDEDQLRDVLLDPDMSPEIELPGGAIIQDWQPLKPIESNFQVLRRRSLMWLADRSERPRHLSLHTSPYPIPYGGGAFRFSIDLFGTSSDLACRALLTHMERARGEFRGTMLVIIFMHPTLWQSVQPFCQCSGGAKQWQGYWEQLLLEQEFNCGLQKERTA